jgi:hypothetical protein
MLSIIIPSNSDTDLLKATLDSVTGDRQDGVEIEVLVVALNEGAQQSLTALGGYSQVKFAGNTGSGLSGAFNTGLEIAQGKYVNYLLPGDIADRNYYAAKIAYLDEHNDCEAVYGRTVPGKNSKTGFSNFRSLSAYPLYTDSSRHALEHLVHHFAGTYLSQSGVVWKTPFLYRRKGHATDLDVEQDVELMARSILNGLRIIAIDDKTAVNTMTAPGITYGADKLVEDDKWRQVLRTRKKLFGDLRTFSFEEDACFVALGTFQFECWKLLRARHPQLAIEFLEFGKKVCWPVSVSGSFVYRLCSMIMGPQKATELLYPVRGNK